MINTNKTQEEIEPRRIPLDAIVQNERIVGFKVEAPGWEFDGDYYSGTRKYLISPAGEDAPDVFKVTERGDLGHGKFDASIDHIILGEQKAMQKAYSMALEYATRNVEQWNREADEYLARGERARRAILVDTQKIK
jgi:hypothetical protein